MAKSFPNTGATVGLAADRTAMTSMVEGQEFFETDTNKMFVYSGSGWVQTNSWSTTSGVTGVNNIIAPPMVKAILSNNHATSATFSSVAWDGTDEYDTDAMHSPSVNNSRITINTTGVYIVGFTAYFQSSNTSVNQRLRKNGSTDIANIDHYNSGSNANLISCHALTATDYIEARITSNGANTMQASSGFNCFWATFLGSTT